MVNLAGNFLLVAGFGWCNNIIAATQHYCRRCLWHILHQQCRFLKKRFLLLITLVKPNEERTPANFSNVFIHIMLLRSTDFGYYYVLRLDFSFKNNFDHWPVYWLEFGIKLIEDIKYVCLYATECSRCKNLQMKDKSYQVILTMRSPV